MNKNKFLSLAMLVMIVASLSYLRAYASNSLESKMIQSHVELQVKYDDPTVGGPQPHRTPIQIPEVSLDGHTLTFDASCIGCTLCLVDAEGEVEYTTVITSSTLVLPSTLEGEFEIQIIRDNWCFYGYIEL